mgnify:CR=1 FL=1
MVLSGMQGEIRSWWKGRGYGGEGEEEVKHNAAVGAEEMDFEVDTSYPGRYENWQAWHSNGVDGVLASYIQESFTLWHGLAERRYDA